MPWPKGKPRGPSPRKGIKLGARKPPLDVKALNDILADVNRSPEARFSEAFLYATGAMRNSGNSTWETVGAALLKFWDEDMKDTYLFTKDWKAPDGN